MNKVEYKIIDYQQGSRSVLLGMILGTISWHCLTKMEAMVGSF